MATNSLAIANLALSHLGAASISAIDGTEDTAEAIQAVLWYDQSRKDALSAADWTFAKQRVTLTPHGDPVPLNGEWAFRYVYPSTALKIRKIENPNGWNAKNIPFAVEATQQRDAITGGTMGDSADWTAGSGWSVSGGTATATLASTDLEQSIATEDGVYNGLLDGASYILIFTATRSAGSVTPYLGGTAGTTRSSAATFTETIVAGEDNDLLEFRGSGFSGTVDTVSLTPIAVARSIVTQIDDAVAEFTEDVSSTTRFSPEFDLYLSYLMAARMAFPLTRKLSLKNAMEEAARFHLYSAMQINYQEKSDNDPRDADHILGRL